MAPRFSDAKCRLVPGAVKGVPPLDRTCAPAEHGSYQKHGQA